MMAHTTKMSLIKDTTTWFDKFLGTGFAQHIEILLLHKVFPIPKICSCSFENPISKMTAHRPTHLGEQSLNTKIFT
jgi:hypothetical protein